jgi:primosomal protein N' (replication factor Y)
MRTCPSCHEPTIEIVGYGTERLEEDIAEQFSDARILRMDLDTTRNRDSYDRIIDDFSQHKADILIGTQMVTKGLDFSDVSLVGIISADTIINIPDFRSAERAFNMLEQVSGRAGRRTGEGRVLIQTYRPEHPVIQFVRNHDYNGFYEHEIAERQAFNYPPFSRIINIYIKHRDQAVVAQMATEYANRLRALLGNRVSGPNEPAVNRIQSLYIRKIMLKLEINASMSRVKQLLRELYIEMHASPTMRALTLYYDVDPA